MRILKRFTALCLCCLFFAGSLAFQGTAGSEILPAAYAEESEEAVKPTPSPAPTAPPVVNGDFVIEPVAGYDGLVIMGHWTPLFVTVTNNGPDFDGLLGINMFRTQTEYDRYEIPLSLAGGSTKRVVLPVKPQARQDTFAYELVADGTIIAEQRRAFSRIIAADAVTVGLLSENPESLSYINQRANGLDTLRGETWIGIPLTVDTFPKTADLMGSFTMLIVDGIDVRTLSSEQQEALSNWLLSGGVVILSGGAKAAAGYPFFSEWTNLTPGKLAEAEDITPALLSYMTLSGSAADENIWISAMPETDAFLSLDGQGLIALDSAGSGMIFTAAFDIGGKPLSTWASASSLWPRVLRQSASNAYLRLLNRAEGALYGNDGYRVLELFQTLRIHNDDSGIPVFLLLALYLLFIGIGGYLLFKKLDRREWLWVAIPASAAVFALLMMLLSGSTRMNQPVALTASRVRLGREGAQATTYIGVATSSSGEMTISTDQPQLPTVVTTNGYYGDYSDGTDRLFRPVDLRQRLQLGATPKIGFSSNDAWNARLLSLSSVSVEIGTIDARLWIEDDGVHGTITNHTDYLLESCIVLTNFGFVTPGDLLPGQTVDIEMLSPDKPIDTDDPKFQYAPGVLYTTMDISPSNTYHNPNDNLYAYLDAAIYKNDPNAYQNAQSRRQRALTQLFDDIYYGYTASSATYYLFAFNDAIGKISVQLNDAPVTRTAHTAVLCADMTFEPIGPTGNVFFHQGLIPAELIVDMGEGEKPRLPTDSDGSSDGFNEYYTKDTYVNIGAPVAFRFAIPEHDTFTIERMTLSGMSYDSMPTLFLYNNETESWDKQTLLTVSKDSEGWAPYIDDKGIVYIRYTPNEAANRYTNMSLPMLALKGEVK